MVSSSRWPFAIAYPELSGGYGFVEKRAKDLDWVRKTPNITKGLVGRGYSDAEIRKILCGNFLRVFERVWGGQSLAFPGPRIHLP